MEPQLSTYCMTRGDRDECSAKARVVGLVYEAIQNNVVHAGYPQLLLSN